MHIVRDRLVQGSMFCSDLHAEERFNVVSPEFGFIVLYRIVVSCILLSRIAMFEVYHRQQGPLISS